jgi:integrase
MIDWRTLNPANVRALVSELSKTPTRSGKAPAPASVALALNAVKGVARALWELGDMDNDRYQRIRALKAPRGSRLAAGRDVDAGERAGLIAASAGDMTPAGARDTALLALFMATGSRIAEVADLAMSDITIGDDSARVRIIGKGDKERAVIMRNGALRALRDWLAIRGDAAGALFCAIPKGGRTIEHDHHMSTTAIHKIVKRRAAAAGVADLTAHDFRRTLAGDMLDAGADIATVAAWMGHADVKTTAKYDRRGDRAIAAAAGLISVPYKGRGVGR